ncbi:MAG: CHASE2 domain-containing protein [Candidatus Acidiferrum sp.]|jgi:CHASE2 domain-containing sensor protein
MSILRAWRVKLQRVVATIAPAGEPEEKKNWTGFRREVLKALPAILITIMVVSWMEAAGWFRGVETSHLDTMIRWHPREMSQNIVIVEISEDDYQKLFEGTSPLDKKKLLELIRAIQKYNPSVIGVDIDTNDLGGACKGNQGDAANATKCALLKTKLRELREGEKMPAGTTKKRAAIVWASVPRSLEPPLLLSPALGSLEMEADREGVPRFPVDEDGSVRHFESRVEVAKVGDSCPAGTHSEGDKCFAPTFARAILREYTGMTERASDERVIFNFYGDRYRFPIIDSRQFFPEKAERDGRTAKEISNGNNEIEQSRAMLLEGKIVLIGGGFVEARDEYFTPLGPMQGVELNALAIQTDLSGGGIRDINEVGEWLLDLGVSIFIVGVFYLYGARPWKALAIGGLVVPLALVSSLIAFNSFAYWFNFVPVAVGVAIDQLTHIAESREEAQRELEKLKRERKRVEVDVATVEEFTVTQSAEAEPVQETPIAENAKAKGVASGAD